MRSLDEFMGSFDDPTKIAAFSDKGQGVERMLDEIDHAPGRRKLGRRSSCPSGVRWSWDNGHLKPMGTSMYCVKGESEKTLLGSGLRV